MSAKLSHSEAVSLKEYVDIRIHELDRRMEVLNNIRQTLVDQAGSFARRDWVEAQLALLDAQIDTLKSFRTGIESKASQSAVNISYLIGVAGLLMGLISLVREFFSP
jgi:hypothetical protein